MVVTPVVGCGAEDQLGEPTPVVGHIAEWARDAALAVPVCDPTSLAGALASLASDEERRRALGRAAQSRALREDADHTACAFESVYQRLNGTVAALA